MRAALYTRVSTRDKGQETTNQFAQLREFCVAQGWPIVAEYEDHESGGKADREQFRAMMTDASRRRFDVVVVWALDRFTREGVRETFDHIDHLNSYGVQFVSFTEAHFRTTGPTGELMIAVAAWIAKQERIEFQNAFVLVLTAYACEEPAPAILLAGPRLYLIERKQSHYEEQEHHGGKLRGRAA
jgi:DNA invertase Pin-like site-specific DNA recombinase